MFTFCELSVDKKLLIWNTYSVDKRERMKLKELRQYIKKHKVKDYQIANALYITRGAFSQKMNGDRAFSLADVKRFQEFLVWRTKKLFFILLNSLQKRTKGGGNNDDWNESKNALEVQGYGTKGIV